MKYKYSIAKEFVPGYGVETLGVEGCDSFDEAIAQLRKGMRDRATYYENNPLPKLNVIPCDDTPVGSTSTGDPLGSTSTGDPLITTSTGDPIGVKSTDDPIVQPPLPDETLEDSQKDTDI